MRRMMGMLVLVGTLAAAFVLPAAAQDPKADCNRQNTYAKFLQPQGGQVAATTQAGGIAITLLNAQVPSVSFSTTGEIEVQIEHECLISLTLRVEKVGDPNWSYSRTWAPLDCSHQVTTDMVPIGLDGGQYNFHLEGQSCTGLKLRQTQDGGLVADPPLPL